MKQYIFFSLIHLFNTCITVTTDLENYEVQKNMRQIINIIIQLGWLSFQIFVCRLESRHS